MGNWSKVEELFHAALAHAPEKRADFLRQACPEDHNLRAEVEALLENVRADSFVETSLLSGVGTAPPPLVPGQKLGSFEIQELIGRGGMGEVYKARDTRLGRVVALKRSGAQFSDRFEREARAIAALNHPNICTLYDVGPNYLVIEFLEGVPLGRRIGGKPLPVDQVIALALQIAEALLAAHAKGIIHRDIKPDNIFLIGSSMAGFQVKVLDFGLAKLAEESAAERLTSIGTAVGTVAYMSPEQARGEESDARTDLFSFGVVLYEMTTGKRPFYGSTNALLFDALLNREPAPPFRFNPDIPAELERIILKLLDKDRALRYQSAADLLVDLRRVERDLSKPEPRATVAPIPRRKAMWSIAAATGVSGFAGGALLFRREPRETEPVYHVMIGTPRLDMSDGGRMAVSPDGRRIAFITIDDSGTRHLTVRSLHSDVIQTISSAMDIRNYPAWSPDGRSIAYFTSDSLKTVDLATGQVTSLVKTLGVTRGVAWGRGGQLLASNLDGPNFKPLAIYAIPQSGGEPRQVTYPADPHIGNTYPQFLPDGNRFLFSVFTGLSGRVDLRLGTIGSRETRSLGTIAGNVVVAGSNTLLFRLGEDLYAQRFSENTLSLQGEPVHLVSNVRYQAVNGFGTFSARAGVLAFRRGGTGQTQLRWFDRSGKAVGQIGEPAPYWSFDLWRDGIKLAVSRETDPGVGTDQIWIGDAKRSPSVRLVPGSESQLFPAWSPDGERLCYVTGERTLMLRDFAGGTADQVLFKNSYGLRNPAWSPDGRLVAVEEFRSPGSIRILLVSPRTPNQTKPLIPSEGFSHGFPQFSPDGRWIAYCSNETGKLEVYVRPFPAVDVGKWVVSNGEGVQPRWRADGREIVYLRPPNRLVSVQIDTRAATLQLGNATDLFAPALPWSTVVRYQYALSRDGERILANVLAEEEDRSIELMVHWDSLLS